jgi:hypothetical protein
MNHFRGERENRYVKVINLKYQSSESPVSGLHSPDSRITKPYSRSLCICLRSGGSEREPWNMSSSLSSLPPSEEVLIKLNQEGNRE